LPINFIDFCKAVFEKKNPECQKVKIFIKKISTMRNIWKRMSDIPTEKNMHLAPYEMYHLVQKRNRYVCKQLGISTTTLWYFLTGRPETVSGTIFRVSLRFYGFLGVEPCPQKLFSCYLMGSWAIFAPMGLLTLWDPFWDSSLGRSGGGVE
jgi:hypothetical protein